jgi:hypothetical protein
MCINIISVEIGAAGGDGSWHQRNGWRISIIWRESGSMQSENARNETIWRRNKCQ